MIFCLLNVMLPGYVSSMRVHVCLCFLVCVFSGVCDGVGSESVSLEPPCFICSWSSAEFSVLVPTAGVRQIPTKYFSSPDPPAVEPESFIIYSSAREYFTASLWCDSSKGGYVRLLGPSVVLSL